MTDRILLTRGFATVRAAIDLIHEAMQPGEFHLGASYSTEQTPLRRSADSFHLEPTEADPTAYVDRVLALCQAHDFALIWPQSRWSVWLDQVPRLADAGVRLILPCPDTATLADIQDKARANARLAAVGVPLPHTVVVHSREEFEASLAIMADSGGRACVKPLQSVYGLGFRRIDDTKTPLDRFLANDCFTIGRDEFGRLLESAAGQRPFLLMEYLAGDERSIDCLAVHGRLLRAVVRRKPAEAHGRWQLIEDDPIAWAIAERTVAAFQLNGLINVQTRERLGLDSQREQCFLEVNPRMSGGIFMACQAGLNLPYWLLRWACGTAAETQIPWPISGVRVAKIEQAVIL